jgi:hypothetical protein
MLIAEAQSQQPKWFFCVGMRRAGSTLQAQLVAALLGRASIRLTSPERVTSFLAETRSSDCPVVVKAHRFLPEAEELARSGQAKILYTYRDIRDVVASICRKYSMPPFSFVHGGLASILQEYSRWIAVPGIYVARYEDMTSDLAGEVKRLGRFLGADVGEAHANELADEFGVARQVRRIENAFQTPGNMQGGGANSFDPASLLHRNHIQSGGSGAFREVLTAREIAALEWQARKWMKSVGYAPLYPGWMQMAATGTFELKGFLHDVKRRIVKRP